MHGKGKGRGKLRKENEEKQARTGGGEKKRDTMEVEGRKRKRKESGGKRREEGEKDTLYTIKAATKPTVTPYKIGKNRIPLSNELLALKIKNRVERKISKEHIPAHTGLNYFQIQ